MQHRILIMESVAIISLKMLDILLSNYITIIQIRFKDYNFKIY